MVLVFRRTLAFFSVALTAGVISFPSMAHSLWQKQSIEIGRSYQVICGSKYGWAEIQALRAFTRMP